MKRKALSGFTLLELLAAMSVLVILVVVLSQIVLMVSSTWLAGKARIDAFSQARTAFGSLDRDIQRIVLRSDLAAFTEQNSTNGTLAFYTRMRGSEGDRGVSLVRYQIENSTTSPKLTRFDYGMNFSTNSGRTLTFGTTNALPDLANFQPKELSLAPNMVRLEYKFIDGNGTEQTGFVFDYNNPTAASNTRMARISVLVLDGTTYKLLIDSGNLSSLLSATGTPPSGESWGKYWQRLISSSAPSLASLPPPVLKSLRVFERTITIPVNQ